MIVVNMGKNPMRSESAKKKKKNCNNSIKLYSVTNVID